MQALNFTPCELPWNPIERRSAGKGKDQVTIVEAIVRELDRRGYTGARVAEEFGVGKTWLSEVRRGRIPNANTAQSIYEKLFGRSLHNED